MAEAERQIKLILNPPTAEVGAVYTGRVVNITKFGAFVNILPGRDGLVHISKLGGGKRIDKVEDVVDLGDEIEVRVDDVDPNGKVSLSPTSRRSPRRRRRWRRPSAERRPAPARSRLRRRALERRSAATGSGPARRSRSRTSFDAEIREEFGDLGPAEQSGGGGDRNSGGRRGGGRRSNAAPRPERSR